MKNRVLAFQAKAFFNAYHNLQRFASQGYEAEFWVPILVNGAFSAELAMKSILIENDILYNKEHNLYELFVLLPDDFKHELLQYCFAFAPNFCDADKWITELLLISNTFIDWRYCFEGKQLPAINVGYFHAFVHAAFCTLTSHYDVEVQKREPVDISIEELDKRIEKNRKESIEKIVAEIEKNRARRKK